MEEGNITKAVAIPQRHRYQCDICMLLDTEAEKSTRWHIYKEGITEIEDSFICSGCLEMIKDIRKKCHQKVDNPKHKIFDTWLPWFAKEVPGLAEALREMMI